MLLTKGFRNNAPYLLTIVLLSSISCSKKEPDVNTLFQKKSAEQSGLDFANMLFENDSINIIDNEFVYNGAGVALGDVDGDGKDDIFLSGNQVQNRLYLNKGNLKFQDITEKSGIIKPDSLMWSSGVTIVDLNADGKNDVYVCNTFRKNPELRKNLLFINQGNQDGIPIFKEMAQEYGLADSSYSSHAQFFDSDNDGDLDVFIGVNQIDGINPSEFRPKDDDGASPSRDRLYLQESMPDASHPYFENVSDQAGIVYHGYSHSSIVNDFNQDGYFDIYVANDFLSNDIVYINNQNGTYSNRVKEIFKHTSLSSMGSDITDVNHDGKMDLYVTEMQPYYNKRKKLFQGPSNYQKEIFTKKYNFQPQYARNVLHLNTGKNPKNKLPVYNDVGIMTGLQETDWSWAPLFADFDNDGNQDLFVSNGFPRDVTDRDFGDFRVTASRLVSKQNLIDAIPQIKIPNFIFKNNGNLHWEDVTKEWGLDFGTFSNGAAYGDLDQDGDQDLVINNINSKVLLLENKANELYNNHHFVALKLVGNAKNSSGIGTEVILYQDSSLQKKSVLSGRGYLSQPSRTLHFGLGTKAKFDSIVVIWPGNQKQKITTNLVDTLLTIIHNPVPLAEKVLRDAVFEEVTIAKNLAHLAKDIDFIDFNFQSTIPHKFSQYGPSLAVGDINKDGLEDMFVAASRGFKEKWFIQKADGSFEQKEVNYKTSTSLEEEDSASLLFDADGDGDLDLYLARGCAQYPPKHPYYRDVLLQNDGNGNFIDVSNTMPDFRVNSSVVKAADYDQDGDLDLFVGSRVLPFSYPKAERSMILENQSESGKIKFVEATKDMNEALASPSLVSDALWTDFNGDSWPDLILASEWENLRFFQNEKGKLIEIKTDFENLKGWWNSLSAADLDNDGDIDYIAGNCGTNIYTKGSIDEPVRLYAKDLDNNGSIDPLISYYLRDSLGTKREYLYHPWQDVTKQFVGIRKRFNSFGEFGELTVPEMFTDSTLQNALVYEMNYMHTSWIENKGNNTFEMHMLPVEAQLAPVFATSAQDIDQDGYLDILMVGNDFGMEVQQGPADALNGAVLQNLGNRKFKAMGLDKSHFYVPGNAKAMIAIDQPNNERLFVISQNNDSLKVLTNTEQKPKSLVTVKPNEVKALIKLNNGTVRVSEFYWGSSFMSQSTRSIAVNAFIREIRFFDQAGNETRSITY